MEFLCSLVTCKFLLNFPPVRKRCVNFRLAGRTCVNFCQVFVPLVDFPSTFFNSPCSQNIFCKLPWNFLAARRPSVNFIWSQENFHQPLSTFQKNLSSTSLNIPCCWETFRHLRQLPMPTEVILTTSVNFLCGQETFLQLPSPFRVASRPSVINGRSPVRPKTWRKFTEGLPTT